LNQIGEQQSQMASPYSHSTLVEKLSAQRQLGWNSFFVLFSDIDRTLVLEEGTAEDRQAYSVATREVFRLLERNHIPLIVVTGNDLAMVQDYLSEGRLPAMPDVAVVAVGSEIFVQQRSGRMLPDEQYSQQMRRQFPRHSQSSVKNQNKQQNKDDAVVPGIYELCQELVAKVKAKFPNTDFDFQPRDKLSLTSDQPPQPYKISFKSRDTFFDPQTKRHNQPEVFRYVTRQLDELQDKFRALGFSDLTVARIPGPGYDDYDVGVAKDVAIRYLLGILHKERLLSEKTPDSDGELKLEAAFAGDSLNDLQALQMAEISSWVVGGARQDLLDQLLSMFGRRQNRQYSPDQLKGPQSVLYFLEQRLTHQQKNQV
jgi:hydroxymethylpyrimidine pyrophosphatase-like HAD family hydrolase